MGKAIKAAVVRMFTAWSFSRYKDHRTCPRQAHWKHILKKPILVEGTWYAPNDAPKSPAMKRGGDIHKEGEAFLKGKAGRVPASFKAFADEMRALKKAGAASEAKWGLNAAWRPIDFFDWARCWLRVILDARVSVSKQKARVIDFKTGKVYPDDNDEQMELYAISAFSHLAEAEEVDVELWYLDQPRGRLSLGGSASIQNPHVVTYRRKQMPAAQKKWMGKVIPIMTDKRFVPNQGRHCSWCDYSKRKGGECEF